MYVSLDQASLDQLEDVFTETGIIGCEAQKAAHFDERYLEVVAAVNAQLDRIATSYMTMARPGWADLNSPTPRDDMLRWTLAKMVKSNPAGLEKYSLKGLKNLIRRLRLDDELDDLFNGIP